MVAHLISVVAVVAIGVPALLAAPYDSPPAFDSEIELFVKDGQVNGDVSAGGSRGESYHYKWPNATVPYVISTEFLPWQVELIENTMRSVEGLTCARFRPHKDEEDYIFIRDGPACSSYIGRRGWGKQDVFLNTSDCTVGTTVVHVLTHVLGFWHNKPTVEQKNKLVEVESSQNNNRIYKSSAFYDTAGDFNPPYSRATILGSRRNEIASSFEGNVDGSKSSYQLRSDPQQLAHVAPISEEDASKINRIYCPLNGTTSSKSAVDNPERYSTTTTSEWIMTESEGFIPITITSPRNQVAGDVLRTGISAVEETSSPQLVGFRTTRQTSSDGSSGGSSSRGGFQAFLDFVKRAWSFISRAVTFIQSLLGSRSSSSSSSDSDLTLGRE